MFRFRTLFCVWLSFAVIALYLLTDPGLGLIQNLPFGAGAIAMLQMTSWGVVLVALLHLCRKALFDYTDMGELYNEAKKSPVGAGLVFIGITIAMLAIGILLAAAVK